MTTNQPQKPRTYGWIKDRYNPEALYHRPKAVRVPPTTNLLNLCPPVRDQNGVGACTGFGIGGMAATVAKAGNFFTEIYSPNWLYNGARFIEGTLSQDAGAAPQDVFDWATLHGLLYEHYWPFQNVLDKAAPSSIRIAEAIKYPNFTVVRVDNGIDGILSALSEGHCVAIGIPFPQSWEYPDPSGILPDPSTSFKTGGHEMFLYGYDTTGVGYLYDQNSWGTAWADKGRAKIPFSAIAWFKANGGYDAQYIVMDAPLNPPKPPKKFLCWTV